MDFSLARSETKAVVLVLLFSLGVRIVLFPVQGCLTDLPTFGAWFRAAAENPPTVFYDVVSWCDYPPFNVYIFWVFGSLARWFSLFETSLLTFMIKLPSTLFDLATAFLIFVFLRRRLDFNSSLVATSFYAFNPATIFNASIWGQYDAIYTFFLTLSLIAILASKPKLSVIALTVGVLAKPQSIALAPLIAFLVIRKHGWKSVVPSALVSSAVVLIVAVPLKLSDPLSLLVGIYLKGYGGYPYTSLNAFNLWAFNGFWKLDAQTFLFLDFFKIGWIMFGAVTAFSLYYLHKRSHYTQEVPVLFSAFVLLFAFFMLPTRIHERYLFPVFAVLALMLPFLKETRPIYGVLTFTYFANLAYVLPFLNSSRNIPNGDPFVWIIASINLAAFVYTLFLMAKGLKTGNGLVGINHIRSSRALSSVSDNAH
jgi:Gpi18-like mannosyltransferase